MVNIEIVFEKLDKFDLAKLLKNEFSIDEEKIVYNGINLNNYNFDKKLIIDMKNSDHIFIHSSKKYFQYEGISNYYLQIIKYDDNFDLNIMFGVENIVDLKELKKIICGVSSLFAKKYKFDKYYAGYEPAFDKENRFFTVSSEI